MKGAVLVAAVLFAGCAPAPRGSAAASRAPGSESRASTAANAGTAGAPAQGSPAVVGGASGGGAASGVGGVSEVGAASGVDGAVGLGENAAPTTECLPYGSDVILRGVVERPPPASAPGKKGNGGASSNMAWRFRLDSPRCVGAPSGGSAPVTTMILLPLQDAASSYRKLEGQRVEATGVLVGLTTKSDVHVVYTVRKLTPLPSAP